jgi:hypothetical protein
MGGIEHTGLVEEGAGHVDVLDDDVDVPGDQGVEPVRSLAGDSQCPLRGLLEETGTLRDHLDQQVLLGGHVGVERRPEEPQLLAEVSHRGAVITAVGEEPPCSPDDVVTRVPCGDHQRWS